jgi:hypothetical protein
LSRHPAPASPATSSFTGLTPMSIRLSQSPITISTGAPARRSLLRSRLPVRIQTRLLQRPRQELRQEGPSPSSIETSQSERRTITGLLLATGDDLEICTSATTVAATVPKGR